MQPDDTQTREFDGVENRRSPRILRRVPIRIDCDSTGCAAHTAVINRQGAMILCTVSFESEARIDVTNLQTGQKAPFRVIWCGEPAEGYHKLGIQLLEELDFWGAAYDPGADE